MLNNETKRRIDNCRDILVGKLPDPKSQVEQITIALIYKFMDDRDIESEELGGSPSFFVGDFSRYKWSNVVDTKLSGFERLNLYAEGMDKMNQNTSIPQLFRDIFKNAYLPYRDPETFSLFAKEINGFNYEHSEELGNAFEYLLSIMSSQGDAGQFRTPRHIIDFIVEIVEPKKNETILDSACGTAGFLISAYKYIQKMNEENGLTPDEHERLTKSITGYDISPDMVRLSLVNLYLHLFPEPRVYEYDTLTSEERWNENYDVILANPPFMTPKGGIKPHGKFAIKANRSEVLFVDYIMEHINLNGRAGVIVPEGIIFQSANAYKSLRKKMIDEKYLWAVVSLPAGVFNPYSGVKTSILLMDREIAKKTDKILFVKVENDGYDLGAQRRENNKSDLPKAVEAIRNYKLRINNVIDKLEGKFFENNCVEVEKAKIGENGDYNLSVDRYRKTIVHSHKDWEMVAVEESIEKVQYTNKILKSDFIVKGKYPIIDQSKSFISGYWNDENDVFRVEKPVIIFGDHTRIVKYIDFDFVLGADGVKILKPDERFNSKFYFYIIRNLEIKSLGYSRHFKELKEAKIPLPPLSVQKEIVEEIEGYQKIIDGARAVVESYKPRIKIDESWEVVELGEICEKITDGTHQTPTYTESGVIFLSSKNVTAKKIDWDNVKYISEELHLELSRRVSPQINDVLLAKNGTTGVAAIVDKDITFDIYVSLALLRPTEKILPLYLLNVVNSENVKQQFNSRLQGIGVPNLHLKEIKEVKIPLPPLELQQKIVEEIEEEQKLVEANKRLIEIFEDKIKAKIAEVWGGVGK